MSSRCSQSTQSRGRLEMFKISKITRGATVLMLYTKGKNFGKNIFYVRCASSALFVFFLFTRMCSSMANLHNELSR